MTNTRSYTSHETPQIGDVVQLFEGAFGNGIITRVDKGDVTIERAHLRTSLLGQIQIGIERVSVSLERAREMPVYVTGEGGRIDNRRDQG